MAIYIHDEAAQLRLSVTGDLDEQAAKELASCWTTASSVVGERKIVMDLTGLSSVNQTGHQLLEALHQARVQFVGKSSFQEQLIAAITGASTTKKRADGSVGRWLKGVLGTA